MTEIEWKNDRNDPEQETAQTGGAATTRADGPNAPGVIVSALYDGISIIVSSIIVIAIIFTFGFRLVGVSGDSMNDTLTDGDWVLVTPYYTLPKYGDIVIGTKETAAEKTLIKRVIAVAGDEVTVDEYDNVTVNGVALDENAYTLKDGQRHGNLSYPVTVPEGCVMMMGDNRCVSWDSRYSEIGFQEYDYLLGKVQLRLSKDYNIYKNF